MELAMDSDLLNRSINQNNSSISSAFQFDHLSKNSLELPETGRLPMTRKGPQRRDWPCGNPTAISALGTPEGPGSLQGLRDS